MKKTILFTFVILCICLSIAANAAISPAIDILSKRLEMKRCIATGEILHFADQDFDGYFGNNTSSVTVCALPKESDGILLCNSFPLKEGQTVSRDSFSSICFDSSSNASGICSFSFSSEDKTLTCSVLISGTPNSSPVTGSQTADTQENIALFKTFSAADPDNDAISYEIVKYPRHGSIQINNSDGMFIYRPAEGYVGKDSFSYKATDVFGNSSQSRKVEIKVSKPACDIYFSDMENHWAHNSAVKMASTGLMTGVEADGKYYFEPDADMTRGDFLALTLITAGLEREIPYTDTTIFADDSQIPSNIKSYAQYAYDKGIINGYTNPDGSVNFESAGAVTRAEAAVITSKILNLGTPLSHDTQYTDAAAIPSWASSSISSLTACGIINGVPSGSISAEKVLSRAEGAQMICNVSDYLEDKQQKENPKKKNLFNLFGLLG